MNPDNKKMLIIAGVAIAVIAGGYVALIAYSGMNVPFSVVMSQSMQHDNERSEIGCIDTGDIVVVKSKDKATIQSYVKGTQTGYSTFGDYGSVIIYERNSSANPVIHRAIVWLEWDSGEKKWKSEELKGYEGDWYCKVTSIDGSAEKKDADNLEGTLVFRDITRSGKNVSISLTSLTKESGFLTMGDNPVTNNSFDQASGIINHPIGVEDIKSVPFAELPWIGAVKILTGNSSSNLKYVPNSLPSLAMAIVLIITAVMLIDLALQWRYSELEKRK